MNSVDLNQNVILILFNQESLEIESGWLSMLEKRRSNSVFNSSRVLQDLMADLQQVPSLHVAQM